MNTRKFKFERSFRGLGRLSEKTGIKPETIGQMIIEEKRKDFEKYVRQGGLVPETNPVKLAIQTTLIHNNKIAKKIKDTGKPFEDAENLVFSEEERNEYTGGDSEYFDSSLLSTAYSVAQKGIATINEKRVQSGKKPILSGKFWQSLKARTNEIIPTEPATAPVEEPKQSFLKKNKYFVMVGLFIVVIIGIWYFTKKK